MKYQIIDDKGVIYGCDDLDEIQAVWDDIVNDNESEYIDPDGWEGDLKLVQVLGITR